jgi:adenylylsulfate reductase subunit B
MPTFVYMTRCDGCGHCVDICPSDIMHIDPTYRRAVNIEPNMCWECYSCVKACPQNAIDCRGYADFAPLGHSVRVLREEAKGTISWKIKFRDGREKNFVSPITTQPWGQKIPRLAELPGPTDQDLDSQLLWSEPDALNIDTGLPVIPKNKFKQGVYY